ncbi:MAG: isocyanide synthase family protein [Nitrososphaera sp.]|nr:isocyanide synthase family protein [Nitrososphaera sp.]
MASLTDLERSWANETLPGEYRMERHLMYDATYGCAFKPTRLRRGDWGKFNTNEVLNEEWVVHSLIAMARDESSGRTEGELFTPDRDMTPLDEQLVYDLMEKMERRLAYGQSAEAIYERQDVPAPDKISMILSDRLVGNKNNGNRETKAEIVRGIESAEANDTPITFVLPAFPFKDQNQFRTDLPPYVPDLAEVALMLHLHCIALAINQVYRRDVQWIIVSDGTVYEDIFGVTRGASARYIAALRDWRRKLNLGNSLHIIDMNTLIARHDATEIQGRGFRDCEREIREIIRAGCDGPEPLGNTSVRAAIQDLATGLLWNRGWMAHEEKVGRDVIWKLLQCSCSRDQVGTELATIAGEMWHVALETAVAYAAFNLSMRRTNLLKAFFPDAIRATSHAKDGQVAIPREFGVSAWNGVGVLDLGSDQCYYVSARPLCQVGPTKVKRFSLHAGLYPFLFASPQLLERYC